ncbi:MAG: class I SAM-dependent methyltransferase [Phycisphaerales bacterium JB063]
MSPTEFSDIARDYYRRRDFVGLFEALYAQVDGDPARVPWADLAPNPILQRWLREQGAVRPGQRAAVVGCGLGDDANRLAELGYETLGFDVAPSAIAWARQRFDRHRLGFETADLFDLPAQWRRGFDLVVEIYTFQALPMAVRPDAMDHAASLVAPGGRLVVVCRGRDADEPATKLPFPLIRAEFDRLTRTGLVETRFEDFMDDESPPVRRFLAEYTRPKI